MSSTITGKQHLYTWMLSKIADFRGLATIETATSHVRQRLKDLALQADLLHNIPWTITSPDITEKDVSFLNSSARYYLSHARCDDPNHRFFKLMIYQLFRLVASQRQSELEWSGPVLDDEERKMLELEPEHATNSP